ncbi:MAG TPA: DUF1549 domain-containing protein [Thermoanaerobaculia bacterium]|nr:DUF1549 domain-containing protein [Thermoanaerobaculia bacterium]
MTDSIGSSPAAADCAFMASRADPDGRARRAEASRVARDFSAGHPAAVASSGAFTGVASHVRRVHANYVDDEIFGSMDSARVKPAPPSSDAEFLRRVTLDLTGRIPDASAVTAFLADASSDKRSRTIDSLLASEAFVDRWTFFYDEMFRNTAFASSGRLYPAGRNAWHAYFQDAVRSRKPWDAMAREVIASAGDTTGAGGANFVARGIQTNGPGQDTLDNLAASTGTIFLGEGALFCTSCHNGLAHLDAINLWGSTVRRQDFWGIAAFYSRVSITRHAAGQNASYYTVGDRPAGNYALNTTTGNKTDRTGAYYTTIPPGLTSIDPAYPKTPANPLGGAPANGESYRQALGRIVTADPQFARAAVNTLWKELFKLGIVEPADSFDLLRQDPLSPPPGAWTIQPTHPSLLTKLAQDYAGHGYDLRHILGVMAKSSAYQLSSFYDGEWSEAHTPYFARHFARRMTAEEIFDAITKATSVAASLAVTGSQNVAWALQLPDVQEPGARTVAGNFLNTFLRGDRDGDARSDEFSIAQSLLLLNDTTVTSRIKSGAPGSAVNKLVLANATPVQIVTSLYVSTLSRSPSPSEQAAGVALFSSTSGQSMAQIAEDLQFALLNKLDFLYNY